MFRSVSILFALAASVSAASTLNIVAREVQITGVRDGGVDTFTVTTIEPIGKGKFGWLGTGFGNRMTNAPMMVFWPNEDGTCTFGQRLATDYDDAPIDPSPPRVAKLVKDKTWSNETSTGFTFTVPSDDKDTFSMMYAYSTANPKTNDPAAQLFSHHWSRRVEAKFEAQAAGAAAIQNAGVNLALPKVEDSESAASSESASAVPAASSVSSETIDGLVGATASGPASAEPSASESAASEKAPASTTASAEAEATSEAAAEPSEAAAEPSEAAAEPSEAAAEPTSKKQCKRNRKRLRRRYGGEA